MPSQVVTNISAWLPSQSWLLTVSRIRAGFMPVWALFFSSVLAITMNSAAGTPLPDTSAITRQR